MRTVAIIQARMGSSRFPGKSLQLLAGKPVLWHVIHRLKKCKRVNDIVVATTVNICDEPLVGFARSERVNVVRGSEENVLERFCQAARETTADIVLRVTGDAPLIDPELIDSLISLLDDEKIEYAVGDPSMKSIHEGFDPIRRATLERLAAVAGHDPVAKEHVTAYLKLHPDFAKTAYLAIPELHQFSGARISVDTPADLEFLNTIYARLQAAPGEISISGLVLLLKSEPKLLDINSRVRQKKVEKPNRSAVIRCDGDSGLGLGHVVRSIALAEELRDARGCGVIFAMESRQEGYDLVRKAGYPVEIRPAETAEENWLDGLLTSRKPDLLILDIRTGLPGRALTRWRESGIRVATIDDSSERRLYAEFVFCPPVPQLNEMSWDGMAGRLCSGFEWVLLRREFSRASIARDSCRGEGRKKTLLIAVGGGDIAGITLKAVEALRYVDCRHLLTKIVLGSAFRRDSELEVLSREYKESIELIRAPEHIGEIMKSVDLAVVSFGMMAYELVAAGVPSIYLCLTSDHARSAQLLVNSRVGKSLGVSESVSAEDLAKAIESLLKDEVELGVMRDRCLGLIDGRGAERIASELLDK